MNKNFVHDCALSDFDGVNGIWSHFSTAINNIWSGLVDEVLDPLQLHQIQPKFDGQAQLYTGVNFSGFCTQNAGNGALLSRLMFSMIGKYGIMKKLKQKAFYVIFCLN